MFQSIAEGAFLRARAWQNSLRWALPLFITALGVVHLLPLRLLQYRRAGPVLHGRDRGDLRRRRHQRRPAGHRHPAHLRSPASPAAGCGRCGPGLLRVKSGTDEVITTLMGNFIAGAVPGLCHLRPAQGSVRHRPGRPRAARSTRLPDQRLGRSLSPTIIAICVLVGVGMWVLVNRTAVRRALQPCRAQPDHGRLAGREALAPRPRRLRHRRRARRPRRHHRGARARTAGWSAASCRRTASPRS